jgi:hypothetical protein
MSPITSKDRSIWGPVDGHSLVWWVIDSMAWTDSWLSIAGVGCGLICVGAGEEPAWKVLALRGLRGMERQVGSTQWIRWPNGIKCGSHCVKKIKMHYVKTSNRSHNICNGPLMPITAPTFVAVVVWHLWRICAPGRPRGWPPQHPLPMWTSGNGLLKRLLHEFFVTDVK